MRIFYYGVFDANGGLENFGRNLISKITSIDPEIKFTLLVENEDFSYKEQFLKIGTVVLTEIFCPKHAAGAAIHDEVDPLVDEQHMIQGSLRRIEEEGKIPDNCEKDA